MHKRMTAVWRCLCSLVTPILFLVWSCQDAQGRIQNATDSATVCLVLWRHRVYLYQNGRLSSTWVKGIRRDVCTENLPDCCGSDIGCCDAKYTAMKSPVLLYIIIGASLFGIILGCGVYCYKKWKRRRAQGMVVCPSSAVPGVIMMPMAAAFPTRPRYRAPPPYSYRPSPGYPTQSLPPPSPSMGPSSPPPPPPPGAAYGSPGYPPQTPGNPLQATAPPPLDSLPVPPRTP